MSGFPSGAPSASDIVNLNDRVKSLESTVKKHDQTDIPDLSKRIDKANQDLSDAKSRIQKQLDSQSSYIKSLSGQYQTLSSDLTKTKDTVKTQGTSIDDIKSDTDKLSSDFKNKLDDQTRVNTNVSGRLYGMDSDLTAIKSEKWFTDKFSSSTKSWVKTPDFNSGVSAVVADTVKSWKSGGGFKTDVSAVFNPLFEGKMNGFDSNWKQGFGSCFDAQFSAKFKPAFDTQFKSSIDPLLKPINDRLKSDMDDLNSLTLLTNRFKTSTWFTDLLSSNIVSSIKTNVPVIPSFFGTNAKPLLGFQDAFSKLATPLNNAKAVLDEMKIYMSGAANVFANFQVHTIHYGGYNIGDIVYDKSTFDANGFDYMVKIGSKVNSRLAQQKWGDAAITAALGMAGMWNDMKDMLWKVWGTMQELTALGDKLGTAFDEIIKALPAAPPALTGVFP